MPLICRRYRIVAAGMRAATFRLLLRRSQRSGNVLWKRLQKLLLPMPQRFFETIRKRINFAALQGDVSEWLKEHAWKVCIWETVSRVRISPSPPSPAVAFSVGGLFNTILLPFSLPR